MIELDVWIQMEMDILMLMQHGKLILELMHSLTIQLNGRTSMKTAMAIIGVMTLGMIGIHNGQGNM